MITSSILGIGRRLRWRHCRSHDEGSGDCGSTKGLGFVCESKTSIRSRHMSLRCHEKAFQGLSLFYWSRKTDDEKPRKVPRMSCNDFSPTVSTSFRSLQTTPDPKANTMPPPWESKTSSKSRPSTHASSLSPTIPYQTPVLHNGKPQNTTSTSSSSLPFPLDV